MFTSGLCNLICGLQNRAELSVLRYSQLLFWVSIPEAAAEGPALKIKQAFKVLWWCSFLAALLFWDMQFSGSERRCWNHFLMDSSSTGAACVRWLKYWPVLYVKACSVCCMTQKVTLLFDAIELKVSGSWCSFHLFLSLLFLQTGIWFFPNTLHTVVVNVCGCMRARQEPPESSGWSEEGCNVTLLRVSHLSPPSCRCIHPEHTRVDRSKPGQARPLIYVIFKAWSFSPSLSSQAHWPLIFLLPLVLRVQPFPSFCITPLLIFPCCSPFHSYILIIFPGFRGVILFSVLLLL